MSKSYSRYKRLGICYGSNTDFYRRRRRHERGVNNSNIRKILANKDISDFDDIFVPFKEPRNYKWTEPTDGTFVLDPKSKYLCTYGLRKVKNKNRIKK